MGLAGFSIEGVREVAMRATPFVVEVPARTLDDLRERLARTRWSDAAVDEGWERGTNLAYLRSLTEHWLSHFDWRAQEAAINRFSHFRADVDGHGVHFIHERGKGEHPLPLILTHGYPDSFTRFLKIIPMLTDPERHGGDPGDAFDAVVPSLPGFGFSDRPRRAGSIFHVGSLWHSLMTDVLGYERFAAHGGDWGSTVTEQLARDHADSLLGIHLTDVPFWHLFQPPKDPSRREKHFLEASDAWQKREGAYAAIQGTRPLTLGYGLNDSPRGWRPGSWTSSGPGATTAGTSNNSFTKDELLTNVMIYWVTETMPSSTRHLLRVVAQPAAPSRR